MAHFAEIDANGVVQRVVVVANAELLDNNGAESEQKGAQFLQSLYGAGVWVQTSYSASRRKHYAGIGYTYDASRDAFIPPRPFPSWTLNEQSCTWEPPVPRPEGNGLWIWSEETGAWVDLSNQG